MLQQTPVHGVAQVPLQVNVLGATHVAGRVPLTMPQASMAQAALRRAHDTFDGSPHAVAQRLRHAIWQKVFAEGAE